MNELHLFAGAGGGILGGILLGHTTICAVEINPYCRKVLLQRQRDGMLPRFPIWDDVTTFDGKPWRGNVDAICGGFPCQDISAAGRGKGITGARSGLWKEFARIIREVGPRYVLVENSPLLTKRGLHVVLGDLAEMGYDAEWGVLGAHNAGAPHKRDRIWILAYSNLHGWSNVCREQLADSKQSFTSQCSNILDNPNGSGPQGTHKQSTQSWLWRDTSRPSEGTSELANTSSIRLSGSWPHWYASDPAETREGEADWARAKRFREIWGIESGVGRVANGVANRVDRLKAIGNGQVPCVAALAWEALEARIAEHTA